MIIDFRNFDYNFGEGARGLASKRSEPGERLGLLPGHTPYRVSVVLVVSVRITTIHVQVVRVVSIVRRSGPVVAVRLLIVRRAIVVVAAKLN